MAHFMAGVKVQRAFLSKKAAVCPLKSTASIGGTVLRAARLAFMSNALQVYVTLFLKYAQKNTFSNIYLQSQQ